MHALLRLRIALGLVVLALLGGCQGSSSTPVPSQNEASLDDPGVRTALGVITGDLIRQHMSTLADDKFEGRGLGTAGYDSALNYVETTLKSYGVEPAGENGGFRQRVPLRNSTVVEDASFLKVRSAGGVKTLSYGVDYMLAADHLRIGFPRLVAEHRAPRRHTQLGDLRQAVQNALRDSVTEILSLRIAAPVCERQNRNRVEGARRLGARVRGIQDLFEMS